MGVIVIAVAVVVYALVTKRLATTPITGAMLFLLLGVAIGPAALDVIHGPEDRRSIELLLEATLALVLFTDSLAISGGDWHAKSRLPVRLLLIGMPLTMLAGWAVARSLLPDLAWFEAALLAICLAPTDAALGQAVVSNPRVPAVIRQALNIESGLNDGLALPFFLLALAAAAEADAATGPGVVEVFVRSLVLAGVIGGLVGGIGASALTRARDAGWVGRQWSQIATLALVVVAFAATDAVGGSGFIAAWVAGVAFGRTTRGRVPDVSVLAEDLGSLLATVSFLGFGAILLGPILGHLTWQAGVYAVLSLTLVRIVPVALAFAGVGAARPTLLYAGWFGPRGLASIVFGLLLIEEALPHGEEVVEAVFLTVALSVIAHGVTAAWGADRYAGWFERAVAADRTIPEALDIGEPEVRRRLLAPGAPDPSAP